MKTIVSVLIACFFCFQPVYAANDALDLDLAQGLLESGDAKAALEFLQAGLDPESTNTQEWFLMAMAAKMSNRPRQAIEYLEKVIELDPGQADRAKLELAQLSYTIGDAKTSKRYLAEVKAGKPPEKVGENIDQFLMLMEKQGIPKQWLLTASVGWMYDSNVNAGPDTGSVLMYDLPFILPDTAQSNSDNALVARIGFDHNIGLTDDIGWQSNLAFSHTDYSSINYLDSTVFSGATGPTWRINDKWILSTPLVADYVIIGHDKTYYSLSYGLAPQLRYLLSEKISLNLNTTIAKKKFHDNSNRDLENYSISPMVAYQFNPVSFARLGLTYGMEDSGVVYYENDIWAANAMYGYLFFDSLQLTMSVSYSDSEYAGAEAAYPYARQDKTTRFGGDVSYRVKAIDTYLLLAIYRTLNDSNLTMYEYTRDQVTISIRKSF